MAKQVLACPKCKLKLAAPEGAQRFRCPRCKTILAAPGSEPLKAAPSPPSRLPEAPTEPPEGPKVGERLAGYTVTRFIGQGGMGAVYEAIQEGLKRRVALKVLPPSAANDTAFLTSFKREAQAVAKLSHPNIIQVFDILAERGYHFFAMEYVDGESLAARLKRRGGLPLPDALQIAAKVAAALDYAYERMLVHRDIKPSNILLTARGEVKVADLGLARSLEETAVGLARGTHGGPVYMAPEMARNPQLADCRSDIYALGAVLFHMLTGQPPFPGPSVADLLRQHARAPFPVARDLVAEIPESVDDLLRMMCAKDPAARFQSHSDLLKALTTILASTTVQHPSAAARRAARATSPRRALRTTLVAGAAVAALAAIVVGLIAMLPRRRSQARAPARQGPTTSAPAAKPPPPEPGESAPRAPSSKTPSSVPQPPEALVAKGPKQPRPTPGTPTKPPEQPPTQTQPPEKPPGEKPRPPKPDWRTRLADARARSRKLLAQAQFARAAAALDELVTDEMPLGHKAAVENERRAVEQQAANAYKLLANRLVQQVRAGQAGAARALLEQAVERFGSLKEGKLTREALERLDAYERDLKEFRQAAARLQADGQASRARAAAREAFAAAGQRIAALLKDWKLQEAAALASRKLPSEELDARMATVRKAIGALLALRAKLADHITRASPRLQKGNLLIPGFNGELVAADANAITIQAVVGTQKRVEKLPWSKLRDVSVERLARHARAATPADQLGLTLWYWMLGSEEKAKGAQARAETTLLATLAEPAASLRAARLEAEVAQAMAKALESLCSGNRQEAKTALAALREKFASADLYLANEDLLARAGDFEPFSVPGISQPKPKPPEPETEQPTPEEPAPKKPEPTPPKKHPPRQPKTQPKQPPLTAEQQKQAAELYAKAAKAFAFRRFEDCKAALDELNKKFPQRPLLRDASVKPGIPAMLRAIASRGPTIRVSRYGRGDHRSLADALERLKKERCTIEVEAAVYRGSAELNELVSSGLVIRGVGRRRPRLSGGSKRESVLKLGRSARGAWIDYLEFADARTAVALGPNSSLTLHSCVALSDVDELFKKDARAKLAMIGCAARIGGLASAAALTSALVLEPDSVIEASKLNGCLLTGTNIEVRNATLTDCVLLGTFLLGEEAELDHVTAIAPIKALEGARGIAVRDSILRSLLVPLPRRKDEREVAVEIANSVLLARSRPLPEEVVKAEGVRRGRADFANPRAGDFRLARDSSLRGKASDKTDLGCRFPPVMLEVLRLVKEYPQLLRPPAARRTRK